MPAGDYEYDENEQKIKINCMGCVYGASIEDYANCMSCVMDKILEVKKVKTIVLRKDREYEYGPDQTAMLVEISRVIEDIVREKLFSRVRVVDSLQKKLYPELNSRLQTIVLNLLRSDPIGAYAELIREIRRIKIKARSTRYKSARDFYVDYDHNVLGVIKQKLENTQLIKISKPHIAGFHVGDRSIYREIFVPSIRPNFMLTRYMITPPENGKSVERYKIGDIEVEIFKMPDTAEHFYYILPPEFILTEEKYAVLDAARRYMATHKPKSAEFVRTGQVREVFFKIGRDMIREVADQQGIYLKNQDLEQLSVILTRYTAGLGVLEVLLADERIQDIFINSPVESQPIMIYHGKYEECKTNLIPTQEDAESWATRLRMHSGRPLDEANPVLDTDIAVPGGQARFCVITRTLSPHGLGFSIRRHRDKPWTLPLFIQAEMLDPLASGLLSFLIDGTASVLVAGGRGAGKSSMLASLMLEMLPKTRIVTIQDSVTGDSGIFYENGGEMKKGTVGGLIDGMIDKFGSDKMIDRDILNTNPRNVKVFAMDKEGKINLAPVSSFIKHEVDKDIFRIRTATGRKISVTGDHSLFGLGKNAAIEEIKVKNLKKGDFIVTPRLLKFENAGKRHVNLLNHLDKLGDLFLANLNLKNINPVVKGKIKASGKKFGYSKSAMQYWFRNGTIPVKIILSLPKTKLKRLIEGGGIKCHRSSIVLDNCISFDNDFLEFVGMWIADGCYAKNSVIISTGEKEERDVFKRVAKKFGMEAKRHSDGFALMINSNVLKKVMKEVLELRGNSYTKIIPAWVYKLSRKQIGHLLKGYFSGDGCASDKEVIVASSSEKLLGDIQTLLLAFGIIFRIGRYKERDKTRSGRISALKSLKLFKKYIGFLQARKNKRLDLLSSKVSTHDSTDIIPLQMEIKEHIAKVCQKFNKNDYLKRENCIGRKHLNRIIEKIPPSEEKLLMKLGVLANSDIFWDRVVEIDSCRKKQTVYDFSVPGYENFVCNNILAHNTLELPIDQLRELGYNIESLKSRSVLTMIETEMASDEALRTALRLGDSALVVGEVRSNEAKSLYEAMRIGALSSVVMGTIHGESAYGVFDRVVNDLGVPLTSFKATDIIPVCKTLRSADGLHRYRKLTEVTEVRKKWDTNPDKEGGFVNLLEYSAKDNKIKPTDTLLNGESETLNRIASYVREWHGDWASVWENINLRAKIKKTLVDTATRLNKPELLEARWVMNSNTQFHLISEKIRKEIGTVDSKTVYDQWLAWMKKAKYTN